MRKKLPLDEKRNKIIGIKVKEETRQKLQYIADMEGHKLSTCIDIILRKQIEEYFELHKIDWDKLTLEEKGVKDNG